jgi:sugar lactone lactonase YvrE
VIRRLLSVVGALLGVALAWLLFSPVPIDPVAWSPPPDPGRPTSRTLPPLEVTRLAEGHGPEDLDVDAAGRVYGGTAEGRILRWTAGTQEVFATTGGRPLGLHWDADGNLLVADAFAGLLSIDPSGAVRTLATECGGRKLVFTDDLETDARGRIWFTDASTRFQQSVYKLDLLENRPNGRLCVYDPETGKATERLGGMYFANGVAVDPGQRFVLVSETARYRVRRVWIDGSNRDDVLVDGLPGFPDGISTGERGVFWIAIASPRNPIVDGLAGWPFVRKAIVRLPDAVQPAPERSVRLIGIDADGRIVHDLADPAGAEFSTVTSVQERGGWLYLGSLTEPAWARLPVPG